MLNNLIEILNKPKLQRSYADDALLVMYFIVLLITVFVVWWFGYMIWYKIKWWLKRKK